MAKAFQLLCKKFRHPSDAIDGDESGTQCPLQERLKNIKQDVKATGTLRLTSSTIPFESRVRPNLAVRSEIVFNPLI